MGRKLTLSGKAAMAHLHQMGEKKLLKAVQTGDLSEYLKMQGMHYRDPGEENHPVTTASIESVLRDARTALPANVMIENQGTQHETMRVMGGLPSTAGSVSTLKLSDTLPAPEETIARAVYSPANTSESLAMAILRGSRVVQAGTTLIPVDLEQPPAAGGLTSARKQNRGYMLISAGTFESGDEVEPITAQGLPLEEERIDLLNGMSSYGLRYEIGRKMQKEHSDRALSAMVVNSITLGAANLIDRLTLGRIAADLDILEGQGTATGFTIAQAAAQGLRFNELAAVVGADGAGAQVENGVMRVAGVPAEMCAEQAMTIVGAFDRSAVAVGDELRILVERGSLNGTLTVTAWIDAQPLVPSLEYFWSAA